MSENTLTGVNREEISELRDKNCVTLEGVALRGKRAQKTRPKNSVFGIDFFLP